MKLALSILLFLSTPFAQQPEIRKYKSELKTSTGKETVDAINNLLTYRNTPEFFSENKKSVQPEIRNVIEKLLEVYKKEEKKG